MSANGLPDSPLLLVFLKLFKHSNQTLSFILTEDSHYGRHMLYDSQFDLVTFVSEEGVNHSEKIFFGKTFT